MRKRCRRLTAWLVLAALLAAVLPALPAQAEGSAAHTLQFKYGKRTMEMPVNIYELRMNHGAETAVAAEGFSDTIVLERNQATVPYALAESAGEQISKFFTGALKPYTYVRTDAVLNDGSTPALQKMLVYLPANKNEHRVTGNLTGGGSAMFYAVAANNPATRQLQSLNIYVEKELRLSFDANASQGGQGTSSEPITGCEGREVALPDAETLGFTNLHPDMRFVGWNTQPDGKGITYAADAQFTLSGNNGDTATLYAQWQEIVPFAISLDAKGEGDVNAGDTVLLDVRLAAAQDSAAYTGCRFGLNYDESKLALIGVTAADGGTISEADGCWIYTADGETLADASGAAIAGAAFRIKTDVSDGEAAEVQLRDPVVVRNDQARAVRIDDKGSGFTLHNIVITFEAAEPLAFDGPAQAYARFGQSGLYADRYHTPFALPGVRLNGEEADARGYEGLDTELLARSYEQPQTVTVVPKSFGWQAELQGANMEALSGVANDRVTYGTDVTFRVVPQAKRQVKTVTFTVGDSEPAALVPDADGIYTIPGSMLTGATELLAETEEIRHPSRSTRHYDLRFECNGGSSVSTLRHRGTASISLDRFVTTRKGYVFSGWYTGPELTNKAAEPYRLRADATLYAAWTPVKQNEPEPEPDPTPAPSSPFRDVSAGDWFYDDVMAVHASGLMIGTADGIFSPNAPVTRGMFAAILHRAAGAPAPGEPSPFDDVAKESWYEVPIAWAAEQGLVVGVDVGTFAPDMPVTREQMAVMLYRRAKAQGLNTGARNSLALFSDRDAVSPWAREAVQWAVSAGVLAGTDDDCLQPLAGADRAQTAAMLVRFEALH